MASKLAKIILAFAVATTTMAGCTENGEKSQKQQQEKRLIEKAKVDEAKLLTEEFPIETDEKKLDSLVELKVKKKMEKDSFRLYVTEVKKYNDSLDQIKGNQSPHKPDPEILFRKMMKECLKKGMCN